MFKPLSLFTYILNNKRKVFPVVLIISFSVIAVTASAVFTGAMIKDTRQILGYYEQFSEVVVTSNVPGYAALSAKVENDLRNNSNVEYFLESGQNYTNVKGVVTSNGMPVYFVSEAETQKLLNGMQWKLKEGKLPQKGTKELALGETVLTNKGLKVGDKIGSLIDSEEWLNGEYEIVGSLSSNSSAVASGIGSFEYFKESPNWRSAVYLVKPLSGKLDELNKTLEVYKNNGEIRTYTKPKTEESINSAFANFDALIWLINLVTIIVITFAVSLLNTIFFMQRANEFGLLAAIGYSKKFIITKTAVESVALVFISMLVGIFIAEVVYIFANQIFFVPNGLTSLTVLEPRALFFALPVPIAVIIFSITTVGWQLWRLDPVSIIEKRD